MPVIPYGASVDDATETLSAAGLTARSPQVDFPHYVTGTQPEAGLLAAAGMVVRLTIGDG